MKSRLSKLAIIVLLGTVVLSAQMKEHKAPARSHDIEVNQPAPPPPLPIEGLTAQQAEQIKKLHMSLQKTVLPLQNKIGELEASLRTEATKDAPSLAVLDKIIEEIGSNKTAIKKAEMRCQQDIRKVLSEDQRAAFDACPPHHNDMQRPPQCDGMKHPPMPKPDMPEVR
ncbi:MAG: hypothetical protein LWX56_13300 [Ignavibacteria bacterium]|nr:hypothetical protein [Ignavibacteria bacterium]